MYSRTRVIAAAAAVTATLAAGSTAAAVASTTGGTPSAHAKTVSITTKPTGQVGEQGHDALVAAVARELHLSTSRVGAALQPLFAAGRADPSSAVFAAVARSLVVSSEQLDAALIHAKESLAGSMNGTQSPVSSKTATKTATKTASSGEQGHDAFVAAVASELHVSTSRVGAALQPLFAAGRADPSSTVFAAVARSLGVSSEQLDAALIHAKESLAGTSS